jgi:hypothetical protein
MSRIVMPLASSQIRGAEPVETTSALVIGALVFFDSASVPE